MPLKGKAMVDNIKINKPLASVSSANRVKPAGRKRKNEHQNLFKDTFMSKQKKKKGSMQEKDSGKDATAGKTRRPRHAFTSRKSTGGPNKRIIDIRV